MDAHKLDGNAAAGTLDAIFPYEMTTAVAVCGHCGNESPVGALVAYVTAIGTVIRCPACEGVLIRVVQGKGQTWLDLQGVRVLQIPAVSA